MAAQFVEAPQKDGDNLDSVITPVEQKTAAPAPQVEELPEKYRGKSAADIARMHQEAEKLVGKQSAELGQYRSLASQATAQRQPQAPANTNKQETQTDDFDEVEFFADPKKAVAKLLEKHPALQELRNAHVQEQQVKAKKVFADKHPDSQEILQNPEFHTWVASSKNRTQLLVQADRAYDVEAADELFSTWKAINPVKRTEVRNEAAEATQKAALLAGMVPTGSSAPNSDTGGKKIYRRADIQKLMRDQPARYEAMNDEITQAYREGRVI